MARYRSTRSRRSGRGTRRSFRPTRRSRSGGFTRTSRGRSGGRSSAARGQTVRIVFEQGANPLANQTLGLSPGLKAEPRMSQDTRARF